MNNSVHNIFLYICKYIWITDFQKCYCSTHKSICNFCRYCHIELHSGLAIFHFHSKPSLAEVTVGTASESIMKCLLRPKKIFKCLTSQRCCSLAPQFWVPGSLSVIQSMVGRGTVPEKSATYFSVVWGSLLEWLIIKNVFSFLTVDTLFGKLFNYFESKCN